METGRVFTAENGAWLHSAKVTGRFNELREEIALPPIRLHDLRYGAATLAHAAGADLKDIQEMLGHSSITITADTCTSLLPETDMAIAEAAARLVARNRGVAQDVESVDVRTETGGEAETSGGNSVPDRGDRSGDISGTDSPSAHANGPGR
ncbi:tyrosine-type recombinase/integrase [Streptomyces sp. NPDC020983]|uniref:tyrosine-type recombinase/integrase n=1 Tax=Streptomyces sp. NPDC020983 TaxID=3365106 RepID=UPI0037B51D3F